MDDPKHPSSSDPNPPDRREADDVLPLRPDPDEVIETGVPAPFSSEPVREVTDVGAGASFNDAEPSIRPPAPQDHLPGDAAAELIPLNIQGDTPLPPPREAADEPVIPAPTTEVLPTARPPRHGLFTLWAIVWILAWAGGMFLLLDHRFTRKFDWNTSYFSIAARNLVRDGFAASHGGVYLTAGDFPGHRNFYAGHPPLTTWLLYGWMKAFGDHDRAVRALPLAFTALNLLLLYALVRRVFGAPAALATTICCSLLPMTAYYAQIVNMEPFVLTFMLAGSLGYLAWARSSSKLGFLLLVACVILGCWTDWPMYVFTGFLAVMHFVRRRDGLIVSTPDGRETVERGRRPVLSSLFLLLLPALMFGVFWGYVKYNGADISDLTKRANERMTGPERGDKPQPATGPASTAAAAAAETPEDATGHTLLLRRLTNRDGNLRDWFINLFTPPALLLALIGALTWPKWTRRLSLASGEAGRRAAFRIVLALVLTQAVYTLAFPQGAWTHEFWQYYLAVPVAVLAAGLCTWLTVAGGADRRFQWGLADRAGWAVAALIPLLAVGPFAYRMHLKKDSPAGDRQAKPEYVDALRGATDPRDVILTDWSEHGMGMALPWYADRILLSFDGDDQDTHSLPGIQKLREKYKDRRVLYLWSDTDGSEALFERLTKQFKQRPAGPVMLYVIHEPAASTAPTAATAPTTTRPQP